MNLIPINRKILSILLTVMMLLCTALISSADTSFADEKAVDNKTNLEDGSYKADHFGWSGGSGRLSYIKCKDIEVKDRRSYATIEFGSPNYDKLKVSGEIYYNTGSENSTFEIPVKLNDNNTITGRTTAMSSPHWIDYTIYIYSAEAAGETGTKKEALDSAKLYDEAPDLIGLQYRSKTEVEYSDLFKIYNYEDGITLVQLDMSSQDSVMNYITLPEDAELPAGMDKECTVVPLPAEKIYTTSADIADELPELGMDTEDICLDENTGTPDYKSIVQDDIDVVFIDDDTAGVGDEDAQEEMKTHFDTLGIPLVICREEAEKDKNAKLEWVKVYGAILGCEDEAVSYFDENKGNDGSRWKFWKRLWEKIRS